jgi:outer membrane receptor for ferrienterochelin and colicins
MAISLYGHQAQPRRKALSSAVALAACFPLSPALAADAAADLNEIVVTAAGFEQKIADAPASISVITQEELMQKRYTNLAQALADVEGVDIAQGTGKTGGLNISIRGMPSDYTLILIDGRRQNNGGSITPNGFGETSTSFMPPLSAIERIEVIRGPMSTLYGSDAMGGVINIITRKVSNAWGGSVGIDHTVHEHRGWGATTGTSIYAAGPLVENLVGLSVRGNVIDRAASELEFGDGSNVSRRGAAAVDGRIFNAGARLSFTPSEKHYIYFDFDRGRQVYNNDDCQLGTLDGRAGNAVGGCTASNNTAAGYSDELRFQRDQYVLSHDAQLGFGSLSNSLMYKVTETLGRTIPGTIGQPFGNFPDMVGGAPRELKSEDLVFDTRLVMPIGESHRASIGGQWADTRVIDGLATEEFAKSWWALYAEDEWRLLDSLALTVGARYEDHESFGGHVSPRAYLVWNATDNWTFKGGAAQGYKTPTVNQLHDGINGVTGQGQTITIGSPQLDPETSINTEIGAYFDDHNGFDANLTLFQTRFKDMISDGTPVPNCRWQVNPDQPGCVDYGNFPNQASFAQSTNIDEAETRGAEVGFGWFFLPEWKLSANYTYTDTEQKSGADKGAPITTQAKHMANASINWFATDRLTLWLRGEYRGPRDRFTNLYENLSADNQALVDAVGMKLKGFTQFHLGGSYRATENVTLTATIYNLFDKDFLTGQFYDTSTGTLWASDYTQIGAATTGTIQEGRRLWVSANVSF